MTLTDEEREFHRKTAVKCFNGTWDLMDKKKRSPGESQEMLGLAHASRYHWSLVGKPRNTAISDWQVSRVYATIGEPGLALSYAKSCLETCRKARLSDILCTAYEAMARAYAVGKDQRSAKSYVSKALRQLDASGASAEDRKVYLSQIRETEKLIG
jgi:hypothetical protein